VRGDYQESTLASRSRRGCHDDDYDYDDYVNNVHHDDHHHHIVDDINEYHRRQAAHGCSSCSSKDHHVCRANAIAESARSNYRISIRSECQ